MLTKLISSRNTRKSSEFKLYVDDIFEKTETILKNYLDMFSAIRINIISGKFDIDDIVNYLSQREYELKDVRILVRSFLKNEYYHNDDTKIKYVAAIYGILECYPVTNGIIIDKSNHTITSYVNFCQSLKLENCITQKKKIIKMTDGILHDLTTSWETLCDCYIELKGKCK